MEVFRNSQFDFALGVFKAFSQAVDEPCITLLGRNQDNSCAAGEYRRDQTGEGIETIRAPFRQEVTVYDNQLFRWRDPTQHAYEDSQQCRTIRLPGQYIFTEIHELPQIADSLFEQELLDLVFD
jgi:hypothetical protein